MSSQMSFEERFEAFMKNCEYANKRHDAFMAKLEERKAKLEEKEAQNEISEWMDACLQYTQAYIDSDFKRYPQQTFPPKPTPVNTRRCFKCQGVGHLPSNCPNKIIISLAELKATMYPEVEEKNEENLEDNLEEVIEVDEGEMLPLESKWDDSEEDNEVNFNLPPRFDENEEEPGKVLEEVNEEEVEFDPKETQVEIIAYVEMLGLGTSNRKHINPFILSFESNPQNQFGEYQNPSPNSTLAISLTPFKEWVFNDPKQPRLPFSNHPMTFPQNHSIRTKQDLFAWLILFQPSSCHPTIFFLVLKPLVRKFCHKDKWKEPTLVL